MRIAKAYPWKCPGCSLDIPAAKKHLCSWTNSQVSEFTGGQPQTLSLVLWYRKGVSPEPLFTFPHAGPNKPHHEGFHIDHGPKCPPWSHHHCDAKCPAYGFNPLDEIVVEKPGEPVQAGEVIGTMGKGGWVPAKGGPVVYPKISNMTWVSAKGTPYTYSFSHEPEPDVDEAVEQAAKQAIQEALDAQEAEQKVTEKMVMNAYGEWKGSISHMSWTVWAKGQSDYPNAPIFQSPLYKTWVEVQQQYCQQTGKPPIYHNPYPTPAPQQVEAGKPITPKDVLVAKQAWVEAGKPAHGPEFDQWQELNKAYYAQVQAKPDVPMYPGTGHQQLAEQQAKVLTAHPCNGCGNLVPLNVDNCGCAEVQAKEQLVAELAEKKSSVTNIEAHEVLAEKLRTIATSHGVEMSNFAALEMARAVEDQHQGEQQDQENSQFWHKKYVKAKVEKQHALEQKAQAEQHSLELFGQLSTLKAQQEGPWDWEDALKAPPSTPVLSHQVKMSPAGIVLTSPTYQVLKVKRSVDPMTLSSKGADHSIELIKDDAISEVIQLAKENKVGIVSHPTITTWQDQDPYALNIEVTALCVPWAYDDKAETAQVKGKLQQLMAENKNWVVE